MYDVVAEVAEGGPSDARHVGRLEKVMGRINAKSRMPPFLAPIATSNLRLFRKLESQIGSITDAQQDQ